MIVGLLLLGVVASFIAGATIVFLSVLLAAWILLSVLVGISDAAVPIAGFSLEITGVETPYMLPS